MLALEIRGGRGIASHGHLLADIIEVEPNQGGVVVNKSERAPGGRLHLHGETNNGDLRLRYTLWDLLDTSASSSLERRYCETIEVFWGDKKTHARD